MIVSPHRYYGVPLEHVEALEQIAQATLNEMYTLAQQIHADKTIDVWNCTTYRSHPKHDGQTYTRLRLTNHSSGYWAVMEWGKPYPDMIDYTEMEDWYVYCHTGNPPKSIDWKTFDRAWGYGKEALYWKARRMNPDDNWSTGSAHTLSLTHPLLHTLRNAVTYKD